eukprot:CAMPEP_0194778262 /NCGR_PEP_ID=MMETSP0323_2-20130528/67712_1 /TAXON_ID=2866 ORGANISM="Crypthecodinium cohnii, Strain Seligo" /NCGR_SAMPLE_ID=MMETSP0323_2 /ASSEMBLY_ACC=CAM_ASM_000346 /LENGTH=34 /DNA_ID= /DNA_START= /DNA_END= /DNA_ORIENTATION=
MASFGYVMAKLLLTVGASMYAMMYGMIAEEKSGS